MTSVSERVARRRIVVTLENSETGRTALDVAVRLAGALDAELEGVFIEDTDLIELAALPFLREIRAHSLIEETLSAERMQRDLRALARQAERMLNEAAAAMDVAVSFRVWRGHAALESLAELLTADILSLARVGLRRAPGWMPPVGRTPATAGVDSIHVLLGNLGQADALLDVAGRLGASLGVPIRVLLPTDPARREALEQRARERLTIRAAAVESIGVDSIAALTGLLRRENKTLLIMDSGDPLFSRTGLGACLGALACPVLILR